MMRPQNELQERYYDLLRLQRRAVHAMDTVVADGQSGVNASGARLQREVGKLVNLDADPEIFRAIERAAWETPDGEGFAKLARVTQAQMRLRALSETYGSTTGFRKSIKDFEDKIRDKEGVYAGLKESVQKLEENLEPVYAFNEDKRYRYVLNARTRDEVENSSFWNRSDKVSAAYALYKDYGKKNGRWTGQNFVPANCFDDLERIEREKQEIKNLGPQIENMQHEYYKRLAAYSEMDSLRQTLAEAGMEERAPVRLEQFQQELCKRLGDRGFLDCFARQTGAGIGGPIILAALDLSVRTRLQNDLTGFHSRLKESASLLEGPIGTIARATNIPRTIDGIERDIKAQALMAGYLSTCAADAAHSLERFRPDHTEGPVSLFRDLQVHMMVNGEVDPAYVHNVLGLDRTLSKVFNVNAARPKPAFEKVLADPVALEKIDRHYAAYLRENAADPDVNGAGFSAGQLDIISFEKFLGRYFPAGTTFANIADTIITEADKLEDVEREREEMGISRGGPRLPGFNQS